MDYNIRSSDPVNMTGRVVGFTEYDDDRIAKDLTRWGRVTGGVLAGDTQWWVVAPIHGNFSGRYVRANRIHTIMPKAY